MQTVGIERTLQVLLRTKTTGAAELLLIAARSESAPLRTGAVRALARKNDSEAHDELVRMFSDLQPDARSALATIPVNLPMRKGLSRQVLDKSPKLALAATQVARALGATEHLAAIVSVAEKIDPTLAGPFVEGVLELAKKLSKDMQRSHHGERLDQDPAFLRRAAVNALHSAMTTYQLHRHDALVEAMIILAPYDEPALAQALHNDQHHAHTAIKAYLEVSESQEAARMMGELLKDKRAPQTLLDVVARRHEPSVLSLMLDSIGPQIGARTRENVSRIYSFAWAEVEHADSLDYLTGEQLATAFELLAMSEMSRTRLADIIITALGSEDELVRLAACRALAHVPKDLANGPARVALEDKSSQVVRAAVALVRAKHVKVDSHVLIGLLGHPDRQVVEAVQGAMTGLRFTDYRDQYDTLTPEQRRRIGSLVAKADPTALDTLENELSSGVARRRLQALEYIEVMGVVDWLLEKIVTRLADNDSGVRAESARLLGQGKPTASLAAALRVLLDDPSAAVRDAVEDSLKKYAAADPEFESFARAKQGAML